MTCDGSRRKRTHLPVPRFSLSTKSAVGPLGWGKRKSCWWARRSTGGARPSALAHLSLRPYGCRGAPWPDGPPMTSRGWQRGILMDSVSPWGAGLQRASSSFRGPVFHHLSWEKRAASHQGERGVHAGHGVREPAGPPFPLGGRGLGGSGESPGLPQVCLNRSGEPSSGPPASTSHLGKPCSSRRPYPSPPNPHCPLATCMAPAGLCLLKPSAGRGQASAPFCSPQHP